MFLKYLEVQGFKSFPDKIKIELHPGITGIVGPNGSGKSNVSDAIRWVLGEQSAKSLRGGKMEDVIFAGTQERKPMGFAEVSVCFDNADRHFKIDFDEVLITRRYFRSGESEYYLNKTSCRLRDIHELMMDTGMGKDGYSMVGQGKIDEIISAKPEDRRLIFEEAAGISKFRYRKQESERKMQQTGENLIRLLDIIGEIEGRLDPLERESAKAKEYLKLRDELKENEISLSLYLLDDLKVKLSKTHENLETNQRDLEKARESIAEFEKQNVILTDSSRKQQEKLDSAIEKTYQIKNDISSLENKIDILNNSKAFNVENINRIRAEIRTLTEKCGKASKSILELDEAQEQAFSEKDKHTKFLTELQNKILSLSTNSTEDVRRIEELNTSILENLNLSAELKADVSSANTLIESNKNRLLSVEEDIQIAKEDIEIADRRLSTEKKNGDLLQAKLADLQKKSEKAVEDYATTQNKHKTALDELQQFKNNLEQTVSRQKMLSDLENAMDGYAYSVKTVIQASKTGRLPNVTLYGTVSSVIQVPVEYTTAIEVAIGNAAQNIITRNEEDAKRAIQFLKSVKGGRATFLPVSAVKGNAFDAKKFKGNYGFVDIASNLVNNDPRYDGVVSELLGRTLVFETLDQAISFSKKEGQRYRLVTLEGEILTPGGAITGGHLSKNSGFLTRKNQIDELKNSAVALERKIANCEDIVVKLEEQCSASKKLLDDAENDVRLCQNELFKLNYNFEHYKTVLSGHENELRELENEKKKLLLSFDAIKADAESKKEKAKECEKLVAEMQTELRTLQEKNSNDLSETASLNSKIAGVQIEIANIDNDIRGFENEKNRLQAEIDEHQNQINLKNMELSSTDNEGGSFLKKIESFESEITQKNTELSSIEQDIQRLRAEKESIETDIANNLNALKDANENTVALSQEQVRIENKETRQQAEFDSITNRMWEDYELTYISAQPLRKVIEDIPEAQKLVNGLKNKIKSLGNINLSAIEEFAELKERYEFLSIQRKDMEDAKETLSKLIDDMEVLMTKQFREQLEIINAAFKRVFSHLFSGGTAELVLSDPENILTSGVEIVAQPPGKKLQNMTLFSGGEKAIIAISLLFALLEVRPSPLCILDEIEAALDDVNVARFASYLRNISQNSQIAIITHRRGTMEEADRLYGVTMQEKGISKLLQLNIDEIEQKILKK
ncbi:MAG: chromosome segregation protein SMC [Clostridia bacterium]|nr:chromosome segregation protein SMC [Clostridia bacterium]